MKAKKVRPPFPDVRIVATFEANGRNLGDCRKINYTQMWERYVALYSGTYSEHELRRMHLFWKKAAAR